MAVTATESGAARAALPAGEDVRGFDTLTTPMPDRLGKYRILRELGEGGMSVVYLANDDGLDRRVAVKLLHRHLARDPEARARLSREARACARLTHPHIPEIYDFSGADGGDDGRSFIVSEFIDGPPLADILRHFPPRLPEIGVMLVLGVAEALNHAHRNGVVHRDVKPENVLVGRDGGVKLTDFGIAHVVGLESMTMTGTLIGSPMHMAPEQIDGTRDLDQRVDVWGFGTVLFMAVSGGKAPFEGDNPHRLLMRISGGDRHDVRRLNPHVDSELAGIIDRCLTVDRSRRFAGLADVVSLLEGWLKARGLADIPSEIKAFVSDPAGYERLLEPRLVEPLFALACKLDGPSRMHQALELLGRVLQLAPDHVGAAARVKRIERRFRRRRGLVVTAGVAATAGALVWLAWPAGANGDSIVPAPVAVVVPAVPIPDEPFEPTLSSAPDAISNDVSATLAAATMDSDDNDTNEDDTNDAADDNTDTGSDGITAEADVPVVVATTDGPGPTLVESGPETRPVRPRPNDTPERRPAAIPVRLTVFPPAARIAIDGLEIIGGQTIELAPGRHKVVLSHPGCPECGTDERHLEVPGNTTGVLGRHFIFERERPTFAPARLLVTCADGGWVEAPGGVRYACNQEHSLAVTSDRPSLLELTAFDRQGTRLETRRFTIRPNAPIVWRL